MRTFVIFGLLLTLAASQTLAAQSRGRLVVQIPFDFVAGQERLPAGLYTISRISRDTGKALLIRSADGRASVTVLTNSAEADGKEPQVSFKRYGDQYFLALISSGGEAARVVPTSRLEKQLKRDLARGKKSKGGAAAAVASIVTVKGGAQ
ncbi:MAG: hypothetical protein LC802_20070 [Acidobacteria bacterium]|nr:hypothetical protein [Acidobacteriota bacterium]